MNHATSRVGAAALLVIFIASPMSGCMGLPKNLDNLKEPKISLAGLAVKDIDLLAPKFLVRLRVENPNDLSLSLAGADVALALNGQPVAAGVSRSVLTLERLGASEMDVEIQANTLNVVQQVMLLQTRQSVDYGVTGHLNVVNWLGPLGRIPFDFNGAVDRDTLLQGAESLGSPGGRAGVRTAP